MTNNLLEPWTPTIKVLSMSAVRLGPVTSVMALPWLLDITGVKCRLPTAGLKTVEFHLHAELSENFRRPETDLREKLINQAGDEQGDFHSN